MDADSVGRVGRREEPLLTLAPDRVVRLGDVGSTNDEALARLDEPAGYEAVWVVAERQLAGRGRRRRPWVSPAGNLYASIAFRSVLNGEAFGLLPLAAAVALADAVNEVTGLAVQLKWPNDVMIDGAKTAGILVETQTTGRPEGPMRMVIGFGVNVAHHPEDVAATHLAAHRPGLEPEVLFGALRRTLAATLGALGADGGVAAIRARWLSRAVGVGGPVTVRFEKETREGIFECLDESGRLVLALPDGRRVAVAAGDVFVRARGRPEGAGPSDADARP